MANNNEEGRLVWNHSTHLPGLIPVLEKLVLVPGIKTVTPGRIARTRGRPTPLRVRVTVPVTGGHKLQCRAESSVQEVFVVTDMSAKELQKTMDRLIAES